MYVRPSPLLKNQAIGFRPVHAPRPPLVPLQRKKTLRMTISVTAATDCVIYCSIDNANMSWPTVTALALYSRVVSRLLSVRGFYHINTYVTTP